MERGSFTVAFEGKARFCFYQGMCRSRLWKQASLSVGDLRGEPGGGGLLYWGLWRICTGRHWKWVSVTITALFWGTWRGHSFTPFLRPSREGWVFFYYQKNFYWGIQETCQRRLWRRATLSVEAPVRSFSLNPDYVSSLSLGVIQELLWRTRAPMTWHQSMGHKGPVLRPRCIGMERAETQLLLYCTLLCCFFMAIMVSKCATLYVHCLCCYPFWMIVFWTGRYLSVPNCLILSSGICRWCDSNPIDRGWTGYHWWMWLGDIPLWTLKMISHMMKLWLAKLTVHGGCHKMQH